MEIETKTKQLVGLLLDREARIDERDDAAIDLAKSDDPQVITSLPAVASDALENETISSSCGESLAEIAIRQGLPVDRWLSKVARAARRELRAWVSERPDLLRGQ